ncbi:MAG: helix-turn-helix transcriptional regulator [Rhodospirillales bacterium]|jgi:DNA-binding CsgD family transcriptional regulator/PAS domain-containing protein|nr:helix-turn-helix transcriptional regulator [Rhodospirillales bacterium]
MTNLLLQTMSAFCDASVNPTLWPDAMAALADAVDADTALVAEHTAGGHAGRVAYAWGVDTKLLVTYSEAAEPLSRWLRDARVADAAPKVWDGEDVVVDGRPLGRSSFGSDWLQAQNLHYVLIGVAADADGAVDVVLLGRSRRRGRFPAEAEARFAELLPHLHRRLAASEAALLAKTVQGAAAAALRGVPLGVALIRTDGGVLFANAAANAVINNGDILSLSNGALSLGQPGRRGRFRELLTRIAAMVKDGEQVSPRAIAVPRPSRQRPVSLLIWPLPDASEVGPDEPVAVVFIGDPEHRGEIDPMRLCDLYGLSRAEARVAALLAQGHRLDETAQILGVAYETVRKHLKQIFSKTGTDRQAELVRMLVGGPAAVLNVPL